MHWFAGAAALALGAASSAQHSDVDVAAEKGALIVEPSAEGGWAFEGELGEFPFPANQGAEPGFEADAGALAPGDDLGFNVVNSLLYWDGAAFAPVPIGHSMDISLLLVGSVTADGASAAQPGFIFAEADADGRLHQDLTFTLNGPGAPDSLAIGAYGLWLEAFSPQYGASNDFIVLLNYGLGEEEFEAGVEAAAALVPEPGAGVLALLGVGALLRRRGR
jgi:hypothetical protein